MSRTIAALPKLEAILKRNKNDVKKAAQELTYEDKRERVIGITDARKLMALVKKIDVKSTDHSVLRDADIIINRTSVDQYLSRVIV